jgi:hypothetical protein
MINIIFVPYMSSQLVVGRIRYFVLYSRPVSRRDKRLINIIFVPYMSSQLVVSRMRNFVLYSRLDAHVTPLFLAN